MSRLALFEDLLERSLAELRGGLSSIVESGCELCDDPRSGEIVPVPGSCAPEVADACDELLSLVREIEAAIGRFPEHPDPQWLDDLLDGKWSLT